APATSPRPASAPLPYTTLFRSAGDNRGARSDERPCDRRPLLHGDDDRPGEVPLNGRGEDPRIGFERGHDRARVEVEDVRPRPDPGAGDDLAGSQALRPLHMDVAQ